MFKNIDWKVATMGIAIFILVLSLFLYMGYRLFTPTHSNPNTTTTQQHSKTTQKSKVNPVDTSYKEDSSSLSFDDVFQHSWSDKKSVTYFNHFTLFPVKTLDGVTLPNSQSTLLDSYNGNFLFKAEPSYLYYYDSKTQKQIPIDSGIDNAKFDRSNGLVYFPKLFSGYESIYQFDPKTQNHTEMFQIKNFIATSLSVDKDVAMVSGYQYFQDQPVNQRNYYSVFIPNFMNKDIFKRSTFILPNTNNQPFMAFDKDIYVASFDFNTYTYNINAYSTTFLNFKNVGSKPIAGADHNMFSKDTKIMTNSKHVILYLGKNILVDGKLVQFSQSIKNLQFVGNDYFLVLGQNMELDLYSIQDNKFTMIENDVLQFTTENNHLFIETMNNNFLTTTFVQR